MKQHRWVCPNGCAAVLGPSRPRKNNICRYCLDCSKSEGVLVERIVPKLESKREASRKRSQAKALRKAARQREKERPAREARKKLRAKVRRKECLFRRHTVVGTSLPGKGWTSIGEAYANEFRSYGIVVTQLPTANSGHIWFGPTWATEILSQSVSGNNYLLREMIAVLAKKKRVQDALFAAGCIHPLYAVEMAFDLYDGPIPSGIRESVRERLAKLRASASGNSAFMTQ